LMFAISAGATSEVVKLLLGADGLNVNTAAGNGQTALMLAVAGEDLEVVKLLLAAGANVNAKEKDGYTALMAAVSVLEGREYPIADFVRALLAAPGIDVNALNKRGESALSEACNDEEIIAALLAVEGIQVNAAPGKISALFEAASQGYTLKAKMLLAVDGINPSASYEGRTPLHLACINSDADLVQALLSAGAEVNSQIDESGETALMEVLQDLGLRSRLEDMTTHQHEFYDDSRVAIIRFLLADARIDLELVDSRGFTALDIVQKNSRLEPGIKASVIKMLRDAMLPKQWAKRLRVRQ
jgi:ankyrin repeat protein